LGVPDGGLRLESTDLKGAGGWIGVARRREEQDMAAWKNPVSGDLNVAANWSTDTVPTSGEAVNIVGPGA
jgi:hypothetical protein